MYTYTYTFQLNIIAWYKRDYIIVIIIRIVCRYYKVEESAAVV